jgi:hypothetical protein
MSGTTRLSPERWQALLAVWLAATPGGEGI